MLSLPASLARAFAQLADPRILWLLIKSLLVTLLLFVALGAVLYFGLMWLVDRRLGSMLDGLPPQTAELVATIGTLLGVVLGGWLLFRVTALAAVQFFADDVVEVVEAKYYPEALESARRIGFGESMWLSLKGALRVVARRDLTHTLVLNAAPSAVDAHGDKAVRFMAATSEKSADTFLVRVKTKDDRASLLAVLAPEKATA